MSGGALVMSLDPLRHSYTHLALHDPHSASQYGGSEQLSLRRHQTNSSVIITNDSSNESVPPIRIRVSEFQTADECAAGRCNHHQKTSAFLHPREEAVEEVDARKVLEAPHPQKCLQQRGPPQVNILIKLKADAFEIASRASNLSEDFNPVATARVEKSCGGVLFMYLQSDVSKVGLIPPADTSEPCVRICGALRSLVNLFHIISKME